MRISFLTLALLCCYLSALFAQTDTSFYSVVAKGKITGGQKVWKSGTNEFHYTFQFNDRGRGDSMISTATINADGLLTALQVKGVDYYKNPYAEQFSVAGDSVVWVVNGERKAKKNEHEFYPGNASAPAMFELLIRWTLKQPGKRIAMLPDGNMHMGDPLLHTITLKGKTKKLKLVSVYSEPSPSPAFVWMTEDMRFFGSVSSWSSNICRGYESWTDTLFKLQELAGQAYYISELNQNSASLRHHVLFTHCNVFQSATATVQKDMCVDVLNGKISAILSSVSEKALKEADTVIDCKGKFLMPGLWDMHGHFAKDEGVDYLAGGVTHLRDMGNEKNLLVYRKQIAENKLLGPDISYVSGFIDKEDPFQGPTGKIIKTLNEGLAAIDEFHQLGYPQIKLYSAIRPEWVKPMAAHAHSLGMKVCGHIPAFMTADQAIRDGYDEITHMNFIFLNFNGDTIDTRTPARFRLVGDEGGKLDLKSQKVLDFVHLMREKHIVLDPTLNVWQGMFDEFKGDTSAFVKPVISWMPETMRSGLAIQTPFGSDEKKQAYKACFRNMMGMLKLLYDNGILLVAGTDGGEANALHHELELYVQAGIPSNQVLKIATYNAAQDCKLLNSSGSILVGREADFILIDGDPIANISDIRRVKWVVKNKRIYNPRQLLASQGWSYYK
jgi:imidazolonepropionase-like amidohydrolase